MAKTLGLVMAFLYVSLAFSLGLCSAQSKSSPKVITVYQDPG
jgi:hypothetical protein